MRVPPVRGGEDSSIGMRRSQKGPALSRQQARVPRSCDNERGQGLAPPNLIGNVRSGLPIRPLLEDGQHILQGRMSVFSGSGTRTVFDTAPMRRGSVTK